MEINKRAESQKGNTDVAVIILTYLIMCMLMFICVCVQGSIVVGIAYDCKENQVYWTDLSARTINRASMATGAEPEILINTSKNSHLCSFISIMNVACLM